MTSKAADDLAVMRFILLYIKTKSGNSKLKLCKQKDWSEENMQSVGHKTKGGRTLKILSSLNSKT